MSAAEADEEHSRQHAERLSGELLGVGRPGRLAGPPAPAPLPFAVNIVFATMMRPCVVVVVHPFFDSVRDHV